MLPQRILVPVDFSESSRQALAYAVGLAETLGASIDAVTIWQPANNLAIDTLLASVDTGAPRTLGDIARAAAMSRLRTFLASVDHRGVGPIQGRVEVGEPSEVIVELADSGSYDLIVMGTHGRTGLRHIALGSVAERVVRSSTVPVATVRGTEAAAAAAP